MHITRRSVLKSSALLGVAALLPFKISAQSQVSSLRHTVVLGDSVSHGATAIDIFKNGWVNLLGRAMNAELGTHGYGFTPYMPLGYGAGLSEDIISSSWSDGWEQLTRENSLSFVSGVGMRSISPGQEITMTFPAFMPNARLFFNIQSGGAQVSVLVNDVEVMEIQTAGDFFIHKGFDIPLSDNGDGETIIKIVQKGEGVVDFSGVSLISDINESTMLNWSHNGRQTRHLDSEVIKLVGQNARTLIFALGLNDAGKSDAEYRNKTIENINLLIDEINSNGVNVVVPDFLWTYPEDNWFRSELRRLASETSGLYIDLPSRLKKPDGSLPDADWLVNELGMWFDHSHPNETGMAWVFEQIAKEMALSVQTKSEVLLNHDYILPTEDGGSPGDGNSGEDKPEIGSGGSGGSMGLLSTMGLVCVGLVRKVREQKEQR